MLSVFHQMVGEDDANVLILLLVSNPAPLLGSWGLARHSASAVLLHVVAAVDGGVRDSHESVIAVVLFS